MNSSPLHVQIAADRALRAAALVVHVDPADAEAQTSIFEAPAFSSLATMFPCLIRQASTLHFSTQSLAALAVSGARICPDHDFFHADSATRPVIPPGVQWVVGQWYLAPPAKPTPNQAASRQLALKLLQLVACDAETRDIEAVFRQDPVLAYHLLRLVNSVGTSAGRHIDSFSQAILILGRQQLKRWLNLMLFAANREDYRSSVLMAQVTARARLMELVARSAGFDRAFQEQAFMAGMFSLLGTLFGMTLADLFKPLKLGEALSQAVLERRGELGIILSAAEALESNDASVRREAAGSIGIETRELDRMILDASRWMACVILNKQDSTDV